MKTYPITVHDQQMIETNFKYHAPDLGLDQPTKYEQIRGAGRQLAIELCEKCPPSRERSLALTNLEQALFWANAAIARHENAGTPPQAGQDDSHQPETAGPVHAPKERAMTEDELDLAAGYGGTDRSSC